LDPMDPYNRVWYVAIGLIFLDITLFNYSVNFTNIAIIAVSMAVDLIEV